ncbi:hypothetical protein NQK81_01255 [Amycolatopsis roodepoortensis]|uniref:hypothetical protein n=1 Tax=Amycolatopsis roodepoortensis TaxID=700274 RepID=UPI00214BB1E0|nr:hypothetical protein [Amycolatopsis roodepoortensis]UUV32102.1 hypothetical protein NQK81_01255 [Amycolatopsis roodepoortensis]
MTPVADFTPDHDPTADELRTRLETLLQNGTAYRDLVRDRAIQGYHDIEWDLDQLNAALRELGLQPHEPGAVTQADLDIKLTIMADVADKGGWAAAMQHLNTPEGRQVLRTAIDQALKTLNGTEPALRVFGAVNSVSLGPVSMRTV